MPHPFDDAIALQPAGEHLSTGQTSPQYANMVGPFGGITAAVLLNAVLQHPQRAGDPIAQTVNYAGPVAEGGFTLQAQPLRSNRSTQHWSVLLRQGEAVCASGTVVLAQRRETWSAGEATPPAGLPPADTLASAPTEGRPPWVRCYDMRFAPGESGIRFDGEEQAHSCSRLWLRDEPPRPLDFAALASLADAFFPRIYVRRRRPALIGTVSLTTFFHADAGLLAAQGARHLMGTARALNFRHGYFDQSAELWSDAGQLLASSHQMVYYRE